MVKVNFFGVLRLDLGMSEVTGEGKNVAELLDNLKRTIEPLKELNLKNYVIFVNGKNISDLKLFRTKLSDGDEVTMLSPVSGG
ncbi:MAG: MoaD/ThiS family protein [Clostridiaceae bacterium]|jgi:MoaD family protein|nr:MoaD/ThiS family protein [Clostridiaceae bacterium]